ncbi:MAG: restriction endonuclease subunit S [Microthrixaceae bacterium]|nr:restriction endonuclease subunit S [Microthrixaceae bacterium]
MSDAPFVRLADLTSAVSISRGFLTAKSAETGEVPILSVAMIRNQSPAKNFTDGATIDDLGMSRAIPGDILVAIEGGTVGETLVVRDEEEVFVPSQQVATLRVVDGSVLDTWYLGAWMTTDATRDQVRRLARGAAIQRVPIKDLGNLTVPLPPLAEQRSIGMRFRAFEESIAGHRAVTACLEELRDVDLAATFAALEPPDPDEGDPSGS